MDINKLTIPTFFQVSSTKPFPSPPIPYSQHKIPNINAKLPSMEKNHFKIIPNEIKVISQGPLINKIIITFIKFIKPIVDDRAIANYQKKLDLDFEKIKSINNELNKLKKDLEKLQQIVPKNEAEIFKISKSIDNKNKEIEKIKNAIEEKATAIKMIRPSAKAFQLIAQGKAKKVYIEFNAVKKEDIDKVYYSPVGSNFVTRYIKKQEIVEEVRTSQQILEDLRSLDPSKNPSKEELNIALDLNVVESSNKPDKVKGGYTVTTAIAKGDLENYSNEGKLKFPQSAKIGLDIMRGMHNLHKAGYIHGDPKAENVLLIEVKGVLTARIADLGKTRKVKPGQTELHVGNPRYAAPEGGTSQKAEVYSTAIMIIHALEGELLNSSKDEISPKGKQPIRRKTLVEDFTSIDDPNGKVVKRDGIEKFLVLNKKCLQKDTASFTGLTSYIGGEIEEHFNRATGRTSSRNLEQAQKEVHRYIDALQKELQTKYKGKNCEEEIKELCQLLKDMTNSPDRRPETLEGCIKEYEDILNKLILKFNKHL